MTTPCTEAELRTAFVAMRCRPAFARWPANFETAMADQVTARLVALEATGRQRAAMRRAQRTNWAPARPPKPQQPSRACINDHKRAAAGDRDE